MARSEKWGRDMSDKREANDCLEIYGSRVLFGYRGLWIAAFPLENMSSRALLDLMRDRIGRVDKRDGAKDAMASLVPDPR
jgi:hypothetical protein